MERVLVTGAGGYIGTSLVPMLLAAGYKVRALDRFFFGRELLPRARAAGADPGRQPPPRAGLFRGRRPRHRPGRDLERPERRAVPGRDLADQPRIARALRDARQGGRGQALRPALILQHLRLPGPRGALRRDLPDQPADHLRPRQRDGRAGRAAARRRQVLRRGAAPGHGLRLQPAHALRSGDQRHDLRRLEDRRAAADARRQPVAPDGPCARHRERPDLHAPEHPATR